MLTNPKDVAIFKHSTELQHQLGVQTGWLNGEEVRSRLPLMKFDDALAGTFNQDDGLVDPNSVVMGYIHAAQRLGVKIINNAEVIGIHVSRGKVTGVDTTQGPIETRLIPNAAGPWSAQIGQMAGINIPIQPIRRQIFTTTPLLDVPFDQSVDKKFELINLEAAIQRMPLLEKAERSAHWAGLYEVTPDAHPTFGYAPLEGFLVLTGFSGHGFIHDPIAGKLISELILDGKFTTIDVSMLDLARFREGKSIQEYNVV